VGSFRLLLRFVKPYAPLFVLSLAASVAGSLLDGLSFVLLVPFLRAIFGEISLIPDTGTTGADRVLDALFGSLLRNPEPGAAFRAVVLLILAAVTLKNIVSYGARLGGVIVQERVVRDLRMALYTHLQGMRLGFFQKMRAGQLTTRMLADTDQARFIVGDIAAQTFQAGASATVYLAILFAISWRLTLLALLLAPALVLALRPLVRRLRGRLRLALHERGEMTSLMQETVAGVRLVKAYAAEEWERRRFGAATDRAARTVVRWGRLALLSSPISETFGAIVTVMLLWVGASMATGAGSTLRPEAFIAFLFIALRLLTPLKFLANVPAQAAQSLAAADRVREILDQTPGEAVAPGTAVVSGFNEGFEFREVGFAYDGGPSVLEGISFTARKGEIVAFVGSSGAGKSTLADLIPRFYEPTAGAILLDGRDIREIRLPSLRGLMGIVSQETVLFNDTVRANMTYGAPERFGEAAIESAARMANAHDFIAALPQGYDTVLGERGTRLSGGERQRLAIARALLRDPPVLILDEATSSLDTESERLVQEAIDRLLVGRTVFVIAHRLSTVQHATRILVLDKGRIVERGRHEELLAQGGVYRRLYRLQFRDAPERAAAR
jgi:subfamily B ATP-binding cassette protein MsbA